MEEINTIEKNNNMNDDDDETIDILGSSMLRTIENDIVMINKMIEKKQYLIQLNNKLMDIKTRLTNLKNGMVV